MSSSFSNSFEKRVNAEMDISDHSDDQYGSEKKPKPSSAHYDAEEVDAEVAQKKDDPPRFSTIFGVPTTDPAPAPAREFESYPAPRPKSGVRVPMAVVVVVGIILLFETTALFAFTVIGLYNSLPARLVGSNCVCHDQIPTVNIAPNFVIGQASGVQTQTVTVAGSLSDLTIPPKTSTTLSTASSTTAANASSQAAAGLASDLLGILHTTPTASSSTKLVPGVATSTEILSQIPPPRSTVSSVTRITVDPSGATIAPRPTVTSTTVIDALAAAGSTSLAARSESSNTEVTLPSPSSSTLGPAPSTLQTSLVSIVAPPASITVASSADACALVGRAQYSKTASREMYD
ncbi:hypothetical protein LTR78_010038 [Recurvomyces mirabilis]|uniref:Uncharacterized protein n=1 Tax=Recurvomyces mirabilis TaxID=574656 RepID=A0AAE0TR90_9PEZI|nr:hypothetical protein LTR78_010038 [Recurvomyces mirabilis]KAK5149819.1 hypothetical protein LTS14_010640 [Recurvomyces mirabilis]